MSIIDRILDLLEKRGSEAYLGEPVSQREHALQAAHLAVMDGAPDALVAAAFLHDIAHLLGPDQDPAASGVDGRHEDIACAWLAGHFGPEVTEPVRLHVMAKRYLCAIEPAYIESLSPASIHSLELQGGHLSGEEIRRFEENRYYAGAVRLRRWDDLAKKPDWEVPGLLHYASTLRRLLAKS